MKEGADNIQPMLRDNAAKDVLPSARRNNSSNGFSPLVFAASRFTASTELTAT
jgi:hypothetical protein